MFLYVWHRSRHAESVSLPTSAGASRPQSSFPLAETTGTIIDLQTTKQTNKQTALAKWNLTDLNTFFNSSTHWQQVPNSSHPEEVLWRLPEVLVPPLPETSSHSGSRLPSRFQSASSICTNGGGGAPGAAFSTHTFSDYQCKWGRHDRRHQVTGVSVLQRRGHVTGSRVSWPVSRVQEVNTWFSSFYPFGLCKIKWSVPWTKESGGEINNGRIVTPGSEKQIKETVWN